MEKRDFLKELNELVLVEDILSVNLKINELKSAFQDFIIEEERKQQVAELEAQESGEEIQGNNNLQELIIRTKRKKLL